MMRATTRIAVWPLALLAAVSPLRGQDARWAPLGPFGGTVQSIAADPSNPRVLYLGGQSVAKSVDGGETWTTLARNPSGEQIAVDPSRPSIVYAKGADRIGRPVLFRSVDGGGRWTLLASAPAFEDGFRGPAIDPSRPSRLYLATNGGVFRSADRGGSWEPANRGLPSALITAIAVDPGGTVYAGSGGLGLFRSFNGGDSWKRVRGLPAGAGTVTTLALSADRRTVYAGFSSGSLYRSDNAGESWTPLRLPADEVAGQLAVAARAPRTVYARTSREAVYRSTDGGAQWTRLAVPSEARAIAVHPSDPRLVYVGAEAQEFDTGGFLRSFDGGARWERRNRGISELPVTALTVDPASPQTLWAGTEGPHLFRSATGGRGWTRIPLPLPANARAVNGILLFSPETLVLRTGTRILRSDGGGASWREVPGPPPVGLEALRPDPRNPGTLYAQTTQGFFRGDTEGSSWQSLSDPGIGCGLRTFLVAPPQAGPFPVLYAGGIGTSPPPGLPACGTANHARIVRSFDGGLSWIPSETVVEGVVTSLAVDPRDPDGLYAGVAGIFAARSLGVWKSLDQGKTWARTELREHAVLALAVSPVPGRLYAATLEGKVFRSADGGAAWSEWSAGLEVRQIYGFHFDPGDPDRLYAFTTSGVWVLEEKD